MNKFKLFLLIFFLIAASAAFSGCGTLKGMGSDLSLIADILRNV